MKKSLIILCAAIALCACSTGSEVARDVVPSWGDQGNGTYINPILNMDFSDPDVTRVGDTYYMVASDFHFMGMQVLKSTDLVNWEYVAQIYDRLDAPGYDTNERYAKGSWAPSIRYHDGRFYMFVCSPSEGLWMSSAQKAEGPWTKPLLVHEGSGRGWEDPCPFWDEDGTAYLGRSNVGAGPIIIHRMSPDGTRLLDDGVTVYEGPTAEGTKIHKWNGWYYLSIPEGGVGGGWQTILRSTSIYGPFERKVVLETGMTGINGPHQGAIVDTPDGQWWFYHFQKAGARGRVVHLQPMYWADGWPVIGADLDRNGIGEPVHCWRMPLSGTVPSKPATSDSFDSPELGLQWQFNHNPVAGGWSLTEVPGKLTIHALRADGFANAHNTLTQKLIGYRGEVRVTLSTGKLAPGQHCGIAVMGKSNHVIGLCPDGLYYEVDGSVLQTQSYPGGNASRLRGSKDEIASTTANDNGRNASRLRSNKVVLKMVYDTEAGEFHFEYSADGKDFTPFGEVFAADFGHWKGARPALFCYSTEGSSDGTGTDRSGTEGTNPDRSGTSSIGSNDDTGTTARACFDDFTVIYR